MEPNQKEAKKHHKTLMPTPEPFSSIDTRSQRPHWRAVLVGLILIPVNCYWITSIEMVQYFAQPTTVSLIFTVVFVCPDPVEPVGQTIPPLVILLPR